MESHGPRDERAKAILDAANSLLESGGYSAITVRSIADVLGGSPTLVTHYYATQSDLMRDLLEYQLEQFDEELSQLEKGSNDRERLSILIDWFLPNDHTSWIQERSRVQLVSELGSYSEWIRAHLDRVEERMTQLLREHLEPLLDPHDVEDSTDALRMAINGIVLAAVEHPADWPAERQRKIAETALHSLPLREVTGAAHS